MDLHALAGSYDLAEQQWGEMWQAEGRTRPVAVFLQALVFLGFLFRHHAPNRPGVLAACGVEAGCLDPACRLPDCKGNYVENGQFHVIHDKTEASHGQRPPAPVHPRLQQLLFHWMDWARDLFTTDPGNLSLFVVPSTGAGMSANYASSYVSTALKEVLNSSQEVLICSNMVRPPPAPRRAVLTATCRSAAPSRPPRTTCRSATWLVRFADCRLARAAADRRARSCGAGGGHQRQHAAPHLRHRPPVARDGAGQPAVQPAAAAGRRRRLRLGRARVAV